MVRIENHKVIIEIHVLEHPEHDFIEDLQYDLIQLMHCAQVLKNEHDLSLPCSFLSIIQLQRALVPSATELKVLYPIATG